MQEMDFWHESCVRLKDDRAVVKLYHEDGTFKTSIVVPTEYYPLSSGNVPYEVFHYKNTEPVTDEAVLNIFDDCTYKIGFCYTNTQGLVAKLKAAGYDAKAYCGWLFTSKGEIPVHHCWCVLDGKHVLDLADDYTVMLTGENGERFKKVSSIEEKRELIASFALAARKTKNRVRCQIVGVPTPFLYYVGTECDPEKGRECYNALIRKYPDHECQRNCDQTGLNATQKVMKQHGLMD